MKAVLIIEDDIELAKRIKAEIEAVGFAAQVVSDGNLALHKIRESKPDLVILDVLLPRMNGFKIARLMKFDEETKHIALIIATVRKEKADMAMAASLGVDVYFNKPFQMQELMSAVKRLLN